MAISSSKSGLVYVFITDPYLVVSGSQVDLRKYLFSYDLIEQVINPREWIMVLDGHLVELLVIDIHSYRSAIFVYK